MILEVVLPYFRIDAPLKQQNVLSTSQRPKGMLFSLIQVTQCQQPCNAYVLRRNFLIVGHLGVMIDQLKHKPMVCQGAASGAGVSKLLVSYS